MKRIFTAIFAAAFCFHMTVSAAAENNATEQRDIRTLPDIKIIYPETIQPWEAVFFSCLTSGMSVACTADRANLHLDAYIYPEEVAEKAAYGIKNLDSSKNKRMDVEIVGEISLGLVDEKLNIDCANGDLDELTEYLSKNIYGFNSESFKVDLIHNSVYGENYYTILYRLHINGFRTPYDVMVLVKDDVIEYSPSFDDSDMDKLAAMPLAFTENTYASEIEMAKKEAAKEVPDYDVIEFQEVEKVLDEDFNPWIYVKTVCSSKSGGDGVIALDYKYKVDK